MAQHGDPDDRRPSLWTQLLAHSNVLLLVWLLEGAVLVTFTFLFILQRSIQGTANRIAAASLAFSAGTFLLAVIATVLASLAYVQSAQRPLLRMEFFHPEAPLSTQVARRGQASAKVWCVHGFALALAVLNRGGATARNVVVTLSLAGIKGTRIQLPPEWRVLPAIQGDEYVQTFQWDGGTDEPVHPGRLTMRFLPELVFDECCVEPGASRFGLRVAVAADGCRTRRVERSIDVPPPADCRGPRKVHRDDHEKCTGLGGQPTIAPPPLSFCWAT